ncbi:MAG: hypothetical protein Q6K99_05285 [Thermostichales cyanobacterium BF4_bins_65]
MLQPNTLVTYQGSQGDYGEEVLKVMQIQGSRVRCLRADGRLTEWLSLGELAPLPPPDYYPPRDESTDPEWDPPLEVAVAYSSH